MDHTAKQSEQFVRAAHLNDLAGLGCHVVYLEGHTIAIFQHNDRLYAIDNRCPHMGFPLQKGTVKNGILTCHWHHARFDLASGGTFDLWADDVPSFPLEIRGDEIWVNLAAPTDWQTHHQQRLRDGLEQSISLVIAKSVMALLDGNPDTADPFRIGLDFGTQYRQAGWGTGLTMHTCFMNILPYLEAADRPLALYHGLSAVARDCAGSPPRFGVHPLPGETADLATLKQWFRQFVEVRDAQGAERCLVSAIRSNASPVQVADMLFAAATDHRYLDVGHTLDFTNKALEALDVAGWQYAEGVLSSLVQGYTTAERMEETNEWRSPVDLVALLDRAFAELPAAVAEGNARSGQWSDREALGAILLEDNPEAIVEGLLTALRQGCTAVQLASVVVHAAALRIAQFNLNNDFNDWNTAHHTFTFAHAVHQGLRRVPSVELLRAVFDAAMSVYLERFLNIPAVRLPKAEPVTATPDELLASLKTLLDRQQQVNEAATYVAQYLASGGKPQPLLALLGKLLLREDRSFHVIQEIEAVFQQYQLLEGTPAATHVLIAATRYLAAHSPTMRSQYQTYQMAERLHQGERVFEST